MPGTHGSVEFMFSFRNGSRILLSRRGAVDETESRILLLAGAYGFVIFMAYAIIRPLRDAMALTGGTRDLPWLFTATLLAMLALHPLYTSMVSRCDRKFFVTFTSRFFASNLLVFFALAMIVEGRAEIWLARVFFVWTSVFNLFILSVFWSFLADLLNREQARRLFGLIAMGVTLGGISGSFVTAIAAPIIDPVFLVPVSILLLETAARLASRLADTSHSPSGKNTERKIGGGILEGIQTVFSSHFLLGIAGFMLLYTITATFLYFIQADIVATALADRAARTAFFARIDLAVNISTILIQLFATGRLMQRFGVSFALMLLPTICFFGFIVLGLAPTLSAIAVFQILRRSLNYGITRPAREVLYTVVNSGQRYKAKNFIDTFMYRAGDQLGAWSWALMALFAVGVSASAWVVAPVSLAWAGIGFWLGRQESSEDATGPKTRARAPSISTSSSPTPVFSTHGPSVPIPDSPISEQNLMPGTKTECRG